ncbi:spore germination protein [Lysinibacillus antri]|uniref:Spore germination protein n=1 Tax=Lysinibacillus antri TaxID=2498145 RepID=A0A432LCY8_9BACI|nr:spore germination protein [Lysinibacillus antri]RUL54010.1 spore germination protein [Lysinibacillus antri]
MDQEEPLIHNITTLKQLFKNSADVLFNEFTFHQSNVFFIKCDAMVDQTMLYTVVLPTIEKLYENDDDINMQAKIEGLPIPELKKVKSTDEIISLVYSGNLLMYFEDCQLLYTSNISRKPNRSPEDTSMEAIVKGTRDNFIEDLSTNIALIRKRVPTNSLCVEKMEIGKRSKTQIAILYFDDIANKDILTELKKQLQKIDTDIVLSPDSLMEHVNKKNWLLPTTHATARADFAIQSLVRGRYMLMVDGASYAIITPSNFFLLLKTAEDYENPVAFSTFERLLRLIGIFIGVTLPAFWLALTLFHQDQLPFQLLATVVVANRGLPFPAVLEMLVLLIMFEMFREAGMRLPTKLGGTISVVGGIIIGDAAIRSGITSPAMVVIIAISTIASFTIANQSLVTMVSLVRIFFILLTSIFGLFGFFICLYLTVLYIANMRIFGTPYLNLTADLSWSTVKKTLFRSRKDKYNQRPNMLDPQDQQRISSGGKTNE